MMVSLESSGQRSLEWTKLWGTLTYEDVHMVVSSNNLSIMNTTYNIAWKGVPVE